MRLFQLIALPFIAVMVIVSVRNLIKNRARLLAALFWVLLWVGIYRGADLLVYSAVMAFSVGFYVVSLRLRQQSREITVLTRELALLEAERKNDHASPRG
jgi:hypothetical protein